MIIRLQHKVQHVEFCCQLVQEFTQNSIFSENIKMGDVCHLMSPKTSRLCTLNQGILYWLCVHLLSAWQQTRDTPSTLF